MSFCTKVNKPAGSCGRLRTAVDSSSANRLEGGPCREGLGFSPSSVPELFSLLGQEK